MTPDAIPTYALYGEAAADPVTDWLHCETILSRSRLHGFRIEPHRHETLFQLLHLESGGADFISDGQATRLIGPCVIILPPLVVHGYAFSPDVRGHVLTLFDERLGDILVAAPDALKSFRTTGIVPLPEPRLAATVAVDIAALAREFDGHAPGRLAAIEARLALVLVALHRLRLPTAGSTDPKASDKALAHLQRFRELVGRDYREHLPIDAYAQRLGMTATHLNRLCRRHLGTSALDVVHQRLVLEAKRHLTFTTLSAKQIALLLAFDDPAYFARFFRQKTGLAPLQYRALQQRREPS
jgi:AraC family transcriptional activator of pobA